MPGGQPRKYQPNELMDKFNEFMEDPKHFPTIVSFCLHADIPRSCYYGYKDIKEYSDTIEKIETKLNAMIDDAIMTARNPAGAIFMSKNKLGYADKMEVRSETTAITQLQELTEDELKQELEKLGYHK
jgi:hypothetical protein